MSTIAALCTVALIMALTASASRPLPTRVAPVRGTGIIKPVSNPPPSRRRSRDRRDTKRPTVRTVLALIAAVMVLALLVGVSAVAIVVAAWFTWHRLQPVTAARQRRRRINLALPDTVDLFVLIVHAGLTPRQAIEELAVRAPLPVRSGFGEVVARLERGQPLADALRVLPDELGVSAVALTDIVGSADRYGLALGPVLEQLAAESRSARGRLDEAAARSLPVKLSFPLVVCTLPSFVLLAIIPAVLAALSSLGGSAW